MPRKRPPAGPAQTPLQQLGHEIRHWRERRDLTVSELARAVDRDRRTVSGVEDGRDCPSEAVVEALEERLQTGGLLVSYYRAVRAERLREQLLVDEALPGFAPGASEDDASEFLDETVPDGSIMLPGHRFEKTWTIRNRGSMVWSDRRLTRLGVSAGPGLITTPASVPVPVVHPGEEVTLSVPCVAHFVQGTSLAAFKMTDEEGRMYFPFSRYAVGLQVQVTVVDRSAALTS